jgi:TolA-binding protein
MCHPNAEFVHYLVIFGLYTSLINRNEVPMKKQLPALIAAILMTGFIALTMVVTSANALLNKNAVDPSNSSSATTVTAADSASSVDQAQIQQLQDRINQYAQREQQYQQREQQYQQTISNNQQQVQQAALQVQQIQQLLAALQQRGLIRIQRDGTIVISGGGDGN